MEVLKARYFLPRQRAFFNVNIKKTLLENRDKGLPLSRYDLVEKLGVSYDTVAGHEFRLGIKRGHYRRKESVLKNKPTLLAVLSKANARYKFKELQALTGLKPKELEVAIAKLREERNDLMYGKFDKKYWFSNTPTWYSNQTDLSRVLPVEGRFGVISDTHLCSVAERLEVVHEAYDTFVKMGITTVFHIGDLTDGWNEYRNHISFVKCHGDQEQALYAIKNFPYRKGITTYVIGGNHDDSYAKSKIDRLSLIVHGFHHNGKEYKGREDIVYVGQYSHYYILPQEVRIHVLHPRGNQAYALSYKQQKRSENMSKNDRPDVQFSGHYHTFNYVICDDTHFLAVPGMQDETEFFKRLGLSRSIGFMVVDYGIKKGRLDYLSPRVFMKAL